MFEHVRFLRTCIQSKQKNEAKKCNYDPQKTANFNADFKYVAAGLKMGSYKVKKL